MRKNLLVLIMAGLILSCLPASAQKFSLSTDLLGTAFLGTMNAELSMAVSQKWSLTAGARYNPFTFNKNQPEKRFQIKQISYAVGARMWPWHTGSGWWMAGKLRYQQYNWGGLISRQTQEGDRMGAGLYAGYTHMLSPCLNLEFGLGLWGGLDLYRKYSCPECGVELASGRKTFVLPDDIMISLAYVF